MPRAYLRLDPAFDERKESYPDGPYAALVATFCLAELQPQRGRFRSLDYLSRLLGKRGRHARYLVEQGDLTILDDGRVYVDGWDEWQEGDWKVSERVHRIRNRKTVTPDVTVPVTVDVTPDVTVARQSVSGSGKQSISGGAGNGERDDIVDDYYRLTNRFPSPAVTEWLERLAAEFTYDAASRKLAAEFTADPSAKTLLGRVENELKSAKHNAAKDAALREKQRLEAFAKDRSITPEQAAENRRRIAEIQKEWFGGKEAA